ncbi:MAG: hypothetical protein A2177_11455 [Spirochaetes bacterium RBG_13_68_11]|nr:MAG: hypothetical protein A2177_11455 [Spirochaetes bacterium RBG_13_68_11]
MLLLDAQSGFYRIQRYPVGAFFGPVDLGLHLSGRHRSLNIGVGLFAGSILPGSNRLFFTGFSPAWRGFYVSSMGGAGLVFDNLGLNTVSILGKAPTPSILYLNRTRGEEVEVELEPVDVRAVWSQGRAGVYALLDHVHDRFAKRYAADPRILATGPAALATDMGGIVSVPMVQGALTHVDVRIDEPRLLLRTHPGERIVGRIAQHNEHTTSLLHPLRFGSFVLKFGVWQSGGPLAGEPSGERVRQEYSNTLRILDPEWRTEGIK